MRIDGGDRETVAVDAGEDLVVEIGLEGGVGGAVTPPVPMEQEDACSWIDAAAIAVDDGVAGGVAGVLVDDLVGVEGHSDTDAAEDERDEDDDGDGELDHRARRARRDGG